MNESRFNYIVGSLAAVLFVVIIYIGGKVNLLQEDVVDLQDRVDLMEDVTLGYTSDYGEYYYE